MDERTRALLAGLERRRPSDTRALRSLAAAQGIQLPEDYLAFMAETDGAAGMIGSSWIEFWSVDEILDAANGPDARYDGVLLVAGDGGNTVYGFDALAANEIVEGDWIGLNRDELIPHGRTLGDLASSLADAS